MFYKKTFLSLLILIFPLTSVLAPPVVNASVQPGQVLVKFKTTTGDKITVFASVHNLTNLSPSNRLSKSNYVLFQINDNLDVNEKVLELKKDRLVRFAQPNYVFDALKKAKTRELTKDRFMSKEWWLYNNGRIGSAGSDLGIANVWSKENKSWRNIPIGIIDSGINLKNNDLKKNILKGYDFVHGTGKTMPDKEGHGSFIAGLIASRVNNKLGIAGLSRLNKLKIMPLKFNFTTDEATEAITYAKSKGVRIINASWGTTDFDQALYDSIKNFDGLVVTASGNDGKEHTENNKFYPCDFDLENVICVGASDASDQMASYSDWGVNVDLLAPGGEENSPLISLDIGSNKYIEAIGTSFSAAFVSGAAGIELAKNPNLSPLELKNLILTSVRIKEFLTGKVVTGGILNIGMLIEK